MKFEASAYAVRRSAHCESIINAICSLDRRKRARAEQTTAQRQCEADGNIFHILLDDKVINGSGSPMVQAILRGAHKKRDETMAKSG